MLRKLSKRDRRALVLLVGFGGALLLLFFVILPYFDAQQTVRSDLDAKRKLLERSLTILQSREAYQSQLEELDSARHDIETRLLDAADANLAKTQLLNILSDLASENGVIISRSNDVPERDEGTYIRVTRQIVLEAEIDGLIGFLRAVAEHEKFLKVDDFSLNTPRSRRGRQNKLRPRMRIYALLRLS